MTDQDNSQADPQAEPERKGFPPTFWLLNVIEMFERLAYFSLRVMAPIYISQAGKDNPGCLNLQQSDKGTIYAVWGFLQSFLPIVTGGIADRYGYKRMLFVSITMNMCGYLVMAAYHTHAGFFLGVSLLATGTALFKPSLQGTLAHTMTKANASMGWGLFYWIVNVGSVIAHYIAGPIMMDRSSEGWTRLFLAGAIMTAVNYLILFTYKDIPSGADKTESILSVLKRTVVNIVEPRLIAWLLIMSCFWLMMYQLWDLQPNFISDWVDSSMIASCFPEELGKSLHLVEVRASGELAVPQQVLISLNALLIVLLMIPVSYAVRRMRTLSAMFFGMSMATGGVLVAGLTGNGWILLLGITLFSLGEMLTGPKKQEYLGLIAPPGKKGLYLGYVNIPVGIGLVVGSKFSGWLYGNFGELQNLSLRYLVEKTPFGKDIAWDGVVTNLQKVTGVTRDDAFVKLQQVLGVEAAEARQLVWDTYHPQLYTWVPFAAIGFVAAVALLIYGQMAKRWKDMNA